MAGLELVLILLAVTAGLALLADRLRIPHPVLLVLGGLILALLPGLPRVELDPDVLFLIFVPPLLYWSSLTASLRDFRRDFWPIANLGVVLVLISIVAVAVVAQKLDPAFGWGAAFVLGAVVSPPDPIAAMAVMRTVGGPRRLARVLEGEGLVNDAAALVVYRMAVRAVGTGTFSFWHAVPQFLLTGTGGVLIGLLVGRGIGGLRRRIPRGQPVVENTISLLTPFAAYLPAEAVGASGVLAVVAAGLYLGRKGPRFVSPATRLQAEAMWSVFSFIIEGLIFILVGLELPHVVEALADRPLGLLLWYGAAVSVTLILVRLAWVIPSARFQKWSAHGGTAPLAFKERAFIGWAGMRGGDSLVIALALPITTAAGTAFPARSLIIFITFCVIFATLVVQGLTLGPFLRRLGLHVQTETGEEEAHARRVAAQAGLERLEDLAKDGADAEVARYLRQRHRSRTRRWTDREDRRRLTVPAGGSPKPHRSDTDERRAAAYRELREAMISAERDALIGLRDDGTIGDDVLRRIQRDLDMEGMLLEAAEPVGDTPQDVSDRM
jgi:CPA1 family monovalent cation:H+ antiporter